MAPKLPLKVPFVSSCEAQSEAQNHSRGPAQRSAKSPAAEFDVKYCRPALPAALASVRAANLRYAKSRTYENAVDLQRAQHWFEEVRRLTIRLLPRTLPPRPEPPNPILTLIADQFRPAN